MYRPAWVEIDLDALRYNIRQIKNKVGKSKIMAVVKADAYGHGAVEVSKTALKEGIYALAVSNLDEAVELRRADIACPILILGWCGSECYEEAIKNDITLTIFDFAEAKQLAETAAKAGKKAKAHLKVDTGMSRIGILPDADGVKTAANIMKLDNLEVWGAFSHFAKADEKDKTAAKKQFAIFYDFCAQVEKLSGKAILVKHIANSAAIMEMPETYLDMVRAGIILYGNYPSKEVDRSLLPLKEVMSVKAKIARAQQLPQGTAIGYGGTYRLSRDTLVATVPIGYADGYNRLLSNKGAVFYEEKLLPIIGRVCMDQLMINAEQAPKIKVGDIVTLMGGGCREISAESLADMVGSISYEVDCLFKLRLQRVYINL